MNSIFSSIVKITKNVRAFLWECNIYKYKKRTYNNSINILRSIYDVKRGEQK